MNDSWHIIGLILLLFLSGFFSASETALMSLSKIRIKHMVEENVPGSHIIDKLTGNSNKLLGSILVGNNIVNIGASALATSIAISYYGSTGVGLATGIMTLLVLIFGELTPKTLATQNSEKMALAVAKPIAFISNILNPIIILLIPVTNTIIKLLGGKIENKQPFITEDELKTMVNMSHEEGVLEREEKKMIHNVFEFGDSQAKDVMTPRTDMVAADINTSYDQLITLFREEQFSRVPIYKDSVDNIVGILYVKDLIFYDSQKKIFHIHDYMRQPFFSYEFIRTSLLFAEMRNIRVPMSILLDEYGGTAGIITIEDLVEEIVGDIHDEYDQDEEEIIVIQENEYIVHGSARIPLVNDLLGINIQTEDFDSIGGFVIGISGHLPEVGETLEYEGIQFIIESNDKNRIDKLRIKT
ncbi:MAG: hemolysin family protein [Eubacteriales bacterium]